MNSKKPLKSKSKLVARAVPKKQVKPTITKLKKEADRCWSIATRLRFAEIREGEYWAQCITCGTWLPVSKLQCGHFMSRSHNSTRFLEENTAPQCFGCNVMHQGRQYEFGIALDALYGANTAKTMHKLAKISKQWKPEELQEIISEARTEIEFYAKNLQNPQ